MGWKDKRDRKKKKKKREKRVWRMVKSVVLVVQLRLNITTRIGIGGGGVSIGRIRVGSRQWGKLMN